MNLPNKLSILRIILIPVTLLFMLPISIFGYEPEKWNLFIANKGMLVAAIVFIIASLTDMADGKIARKYNMITNLGKFLDSLADKMLIIGVLLAFVEIGRISAWWVMIICLREFMVTGIRMLASQKGVVMAAKMIGKIKTTVQMIAIIYLLLEQTIIMCLDGCEFGVMVVGDILFAMCVIMTIVSGMDYLLKNLNYLKEAN